MVPSVLESVLPQSVGWKETQHNRMPLIQHLRDGFHSEKGPAWHRSEERIARRISPVSPETDFEDWERELAWTEILMLSGSSSECFTHLARAWGKDDGFHHVLAQVLPVAPSEAAAAAAAAAPGQHHRVATGVAWGDQEDDQIAANVILSADFSFENLQDEHLTSGDEDNRQTIACQPCYGYNTNNFAGL